MLSSYGWVDPVTKSKVRIPIDRAMELYLAESARPARSRACTWSGAKGGNASWQARNRGVPRDRRSWLHPPPPPAPTGMPPEQIYRLVCIACHDTDGKGKLVKPAMPSIPDLTDPKWQASRTDAELTHSILEGKESTVNGVKIPLMLPMKDKLALAHTEVKDMVAFMRTFKGGKQVVSATPAARRRRVTDDSAGFRHPTPVPPVPHHPGVPPRRRRSLPPQDQH